MPETKKDAFCYEGFRRGVVVNVMRWLLWRGVLPSTHTQKILIIRGLDKKPPFSNPCPPLRDVNPYGRIAHGERVWL